MSDANDLRTRELAKARTAVVPCTRDASYASCGSQAKSDNPFADEDLAQARTTTVYLDANQLSRFLLE